jgi:capsular exopolysaccharide synthesis family protein
MDNHIEERSTAELFSQYATLLLQWSWLLILLAVLAGGTAYYISNRSTRIYQSSALVMINGAPGYQSDPYSASVVGQQMGATYAKVMTTQPVLDSVAKKLGYPYFPYSASVQVTADTNTGLLTVTVTDIDPARAALIANTLVNVFADQMQSDQVSRYADSKTSLQDQMTSLTQKIQSTTSALTALNTQIQEANNALTSVNAEILTNTTIITNTTNIITNATNTTNKLQTLPATIIAADQAIIAADQAIIAADQAKRDQLNITLAQYQPQLTQLQTTLAQYQQSYNSLFQSYQSVLLAEAQATSTIVIKNPAVPNGYPIAPQPTRSGMLAAVVGLMVAAGIIFLIEFLDDTIRDPQEITRRWGIPILGMIVSYKSSEGEALITVRHPRSPISEAFRSLRTNLQFAGVETPVHTLLVTSPSPSDGKTTIVANLASVIAQSGRNVVIVDADLRRPRIHKMFRLSNRVGLTDQFIRTQDRLDGSLKSTEVPNLHAITSGNLPPNPSELLSSGRMSDILKLLRNQFNTIIVDSPPVLLVTDAMVLAQHVDGVLLVVKPSLTKWAALRQAIEQLQRVKANILGVVVNDVNVGRSRYYYYRGYYKQKYGKGYHYAENDAPEVVAEPKVSDSAPTVSGPLLLRRIIDDKKDDNNKKKT